MDPRISEADTLLKKRQYQEALEAYKKAYDTYEAESFYEGMVYAKERMGRTYRSLGKDSLSNITFQAAAALSRKQLGPNHILESKAYLNNGIRAHRKNYFLEASAHLDSAVRIYESSLSNIDPSLFETMVNFKYYTYYYSNPKQDTLIKYLNARGRIFENRITSVLEEVLLLSDYSRVFDLAGDFQKATAYALESVRLCESNFEEISPFYYSDALFNLSRSLHSQREDDRAIEVVDRLIKYTIENDAKSEYLPGFYNLKAVILNGLSRYREASEEFTRIINISELQNRNDFFYRSSIMNLGVCYQLMGQEDLGEYYLNLALEKEKEANPLFASEFSERYRYLGQFSFTSKRDFNKALHYYDSAIRSNIDNPINQNVLDYPSGFRFEFNYDILDILQRKQLSMSELFDNGEFDGDEVLYSTISHAEETHKLLMTNRDELQAEKGKLFFSQNFKSLYESGINAAYELYESNAQSEEYLKKAFEFFSQSKSLLFLEQSGELGAIQDDRLSLSIREEYYRIRSKIDSLNRLFNDLIDDVLTSDTLRTVNAELLKENGNLKSLKDAVTQSLGAEVARELSGQYAYDGVKSYVSKETEGKRAVVDFFFGQDHLFVIMISKDIEYFDRIVIDDAFREALAKFIKSTTEKPEIENYQKLLKEYQANALHIYDLILKEPLSLLRDEVEQLTIIPDDILSRIPFEALVESRVDVSSYSDLNFLLSHYTVNYVLSSIILGRKSTQKRAMKGLYAVGYSGKTKSENRSGLGALPGTEEEIRFLQSKMTGDFLYGPEGSKRNFVQNAGDYDILHLAVHGESDSIDRYKSRLIFNGTNNNVLETSDLYIADLKARLAILSACESGVGSITKGEGTFSMARGFALVGVPTVVMSLWKVNDKLSSEIMVDFHQNLLENNSVNQALVIAKRNFLANSDEYTSHPYYWSAFVSLGENLTLEKKTHNHIVFWILGISVITTILILALKKKRKRAVKLSF